MDSHQNTIAALSTPPGESGLAVVRMSGPGALDILSRVYRTAGAASFAGHWEHRRLYHGTIVDSGNETVDEVICAVMRAPDTYTGEEMVEISCHGGTLIVSRVLDLLFQHGAERANPGEFTKRAFLNGKMDLIQAEAVADLIHARSDLQRKVAHEQLAGGLSRRIDGLADQIMELLGVIEANIDFVEEDIDTIDWEGAQTLLDAQREELERLLESAPLSKPFREGYRVAIAGPVNAGKSSLFNILVGEQRAIVTDVPGTTRDVLREPFIVHGLLFVFQDTAGLRGSATDRVESIGLGLAKDAARSADVVLFVIDASLPFDDELVGAVRELEPPRSILVLNKIDLPQADNVSTLDVLPPDLRRVHTSALTGEGIEKLEDAIVETVAGERLSWIARERVVLNSRLVTLVKAAAEKVAALEKSLASRNPLEIMALEAREVLALYEEATGRRYQDDLLDVIFSRFCIGK